MKNFFSCIFFAVVVAVSLSAKEVKLLTVGNSFAESLVPYLEKVCSSVPDCSLKLGKANHGGCELRRHWSYVEREEASPDVKLYRNKTASLKEILVSEDWDFVSIQQASHESWLPDTYRPYAKNLRDYINKYAPNAEVVMQETWSYRVDDPRLVDFNAEGQWKISQTEMYGRLREAYRIAAYELGLRVIPMGDAVQKYRTLVEKPFVPFKKSDIEVFEYPALPSDDGDVVGSYQWVFPRKSNSAGGKSLKIVERVLRRDSIHLNRCGQYLQACLWFGFLFEKSPTLVTFVPDEIRTEEARLLRQIAAQTLRDSTLPVKRGTNTPRKD